MDLHTKRIFTIPNPKAWTHCTLKNYRPAMWKASVDIAGVSITFVSVVPKDGKTETLRFRAADQYELREKIEKDYPDAVFSTAALPLPKDELRLEYQAQVKAENDRQTAAQEEQDFARRVIEQHRLLASRMGAEEQQRHTNTNLNWLQTSPESPYRDFFHQHPRFLTYPDNSNRNLSTLLKWCSQRGYVIPLHAELCEGMRYLLERNHFAMKPTFKRSERDELRAVREFTHEDTVKFSPSQIADATERLRKVLPVGTVPSPDLVQAKAKQLGIADDLLQVILNVRKDVESDTSGMNAADLKRGLQESRNTIRPQTERPQQISADEAKTMPLDDLKKEMRKGFKTPNHQKGY
jgi:hypothetical protein